MKKILSLLTLTLFITISASAKNVTKISDLNLKGKVVKVLKDFAPSFASNATAIDNVVEKMKDKIDKLDRGGKKTITITPQSTPDDALLIIIHYHEEGFYMDDEGNVYWWTYDEVWVIYIE